MKATNNKGSANMWWIIIGAIMALVVMIILMVIFSGGTEKANTGLFDCASKGGTCGTIEECQEKGGAESFVFSCPNEEGKSKYFGLIKTKGEAQACCFTEK